MRSTMTTPILSPKILLIQSDRAAAKETRAALAAAGSGSFDMEWVCQLSEGIERLSKKGIAAVLLELFLPDSQCQLNRSMQHFVEVYWREFEILRFFLDADLTAAPLGPARLGCIPTGRFF